MRTARARTSVEKRFPGFPFVIAYLSSFLLSGKPGLVQANPKRNHPMFAGTLTRNAETAAAEYTGMIHSTRFDIAIQLEARAKMSERSPDFDVTAINRSGRKVRIGTAWNETGNTSGNPYISM